MFNYVAPVKFDDNGLSSTAFPFISRENLMIRVVSHTTAVNKIRDVELNNSSSDNFESEIVNRVAKFRKLAGDRSTFGQLKFVKRIEEQLYQLVPEIVKQYNPELIVQTLKGGDAIMPHKDHTRISSLFFLYTPPDSKTIWYEKTGEFEEFDNLRYGDIDGLTSVHEEVILPNTWYVFENDMYHSVHRLEGCKIDRVCLVLEFKSITATDLYNLLSQ